MCGIIGLFNCDDAGEKIIKGLEVLAPRGRDACGVASEKELIIRKNPEEIKSSSDFNERIINSDKIIGQVLHAIVNNVPQPIREKGIITANCEIYNWKEIASKKGLRASNDAELLLKLIDNINLEEEEIIKALEELDGVFAFAYWRENKVIIARDLIGVKPLWYSHQDGFRFASEKKALITTGVKDVNELNPRTIIIYDIKKNEIKKVKQEFYKERIIRNDEEKISEEVKELIIKAIKKRIPSNNIKVGVLFSGGIDSTIIAKTLQELKIDFKCYTAIIDNPRGKEAHDLIAAEKTAKKYGFKHEIIRVKEEEIPRIAEEVVRIIEEPNAVKVSVGMPFLIATKKARSDGCRILFSGLGAEELYAGYQRHKRSNNINDECISGLQWLYERDLYRDDTITMRNGLELRLPFLDKELVKHSLTIPGELKIRDGVEKYILRKAALLMGIGEEEAFRPKKAAQYGSKFDNALKKTARKQGKTRAEYLQGMIRIKNRNLGLLCSGGKDSLLAAHIMKKLNYEIKCLLTIKSKNKESYMFHTPAINLVEMQSKASGIPLIEEETSGEKEKELEDLKKLLIRAKKEYKIEGIITGALYSQYQRERIERISDELDLKTYSPLWHLQQESELRELLREGFKITMTAIAGEGLSKEWLGRIIREEELKELIRLNKKIGFHIAGEGGEYESLVLDCPLFKKEIILKETIIESENQITARLIIKKAELKEKNHLK